MRKQNSKPAHDGPRTNPEGAAASSGESFDAWAIVELMGHRKIAGRVSEQIIAGTPLLRIDVPGTDKVAGFTQYYGSHAIYCLTPASEKICRAYSSAHRERPVEAYELPALNAARLPGEPEPEDQP